MSLFNIFRGRPPIRDRHELAQFIDENSAFLVQKGMYEYSRARAGHYAKVLFTEPEFQEALERSRWNAFPLGLAIVGELVEGVLRPLAGDAEGSQHLETLRALVLSVFDRYQTPAALGEESWRQLRADLARRLQLIGLHPVKRSFDIAGPFDRARYAMKPSHGPKADVEIEQLAERDVE